VQNAGNTMGEIVASVQRVTDVIGEITAASGEQSEGIAQVNTAVGQLDHMTQQNAALVEQVAAAADSLTHQTMRLQQALAVYVTGNDGVPESAIVKRQAPQVRQARLAGAQAAAPAQARGTTSLPPPRRHPDADAPRLAKPVSKTVAEKPMNKSATAQKSSKLPPPAPVARPAARAAAAAPRPATKASAVAEGDWETF
jgi:uncharacterized phage infection (PIP) family protein YhgE